MNAVKNQTPVKLVTGAFVATLDYMITIGNVLAVVSYIDRSNQIVYATGAALKHSGVDINGRRAASPSKDVTTYIATISNGKEKFHNGISISTEIGESMLLYTRDTEEEVIYSYLMKKFELPLLREWTRSIIAELRKKGRLNENYKIFGRQDAMMYLGDKQVAVENVIGCQVVLDEQVLEQTVTSLIKSGVIRVTDTPQHKLSVEGMDDYFSQFSASLVSNLKEQLHPVSEHTQDMPYAALKKKRLYPQQISQDVGCINALLEKKTDYIILNMGMGTGKTIQAATICDGYANAKAMRSGKTLKEVYEQGDVKYRNIIMCPSHLVDKWCNEIRKEIPEATATAVTEFSQLVKLREQGRERRGREFFVISKDFAKLSYQSRPCVYQYGARKPKAYVCDKCGKHRPYSDRREHQCECGGTYCKTLLSDKPKRGMICPECGELLFPANRKVDVSKYADKPTEPLGPENFASMNGSNLNCHLCGTSLWTPCIANIDMGGEYSAWASRSMKWKKITHYANKAHKSTKTVWVHKEYEDMYLGMVGESVLSEEDDVASPRKFAPAAYIKKYLRGYFDFAIFDEMHLYKGGETAQGNAMHALIKASKFKLGLTGTIAGGYASHFFYTLFRLEPARMIKHGFTWTSENAFCEKYGTMVREYMFETTGDGNYNKSSRGRQLSTPKQEPGISPLIFTDFLLDRTVFLDLSDMSRFLPSLKEQVVTVPLEDNIKASYSKVVDTLKENSRKQGGFGLISRMLQFSLSYTDKAYGVEPIKNPVNGSVVCIPDSFDEYRKADRLTNKENKLIELIKSELKENRNCVVFADYTASPETCVSYRIKDILMTHLGLYDNEVVVLESASPPAVKREAWIHKKASEGAKVFITNPKCVETGLDLCFEYEGAKYNYPTLLFYQMGYNMFTIWQASRRAYRLNQTEECRNYYIASEGTVQPAVIKLIAEKQVATAAIQGHFSAEGLAAMAQGVDARLRLVQALASNDTESQNELQNMFDVIAASKGDDTSYADYRPMLTFDELMGRTEKETGDVEDIFDFIDNDLFAFCVMEDREKAGTPIESPVKPERSRHRNKSDRDAAVSMFELMFS